MQFYIPEISDEVRLLKDWQFRLYNESRNESLDKFLKVGFPPRSSQKDPPILVTIPAGTVLIIDRVYIRKGQTDFSSITFRWKGASNPAYFETREDYGHVIINGVKVSRDWRLHKGMPNPTYQAKVPKEQIRFWAKLKDVNEIECEKA